MRKVLLVMTSLLLAAPLLGQQKRLWVLRAPGEMVEYDPATFAVKQTVKVVVGAVQSPENISVNRLGQILYEPQFHCRFRREMRSRSTSCGFGTDRPRAALPRRRLLL